MKDQSGKTRNLGLVAGLAALTAPVYMGGLGAAAGLLLSSALGGGSIPLIALFGCMGLISGVIIMTISFGVYRPKENKATKLAAKVFNHALSVGKTFKAGYNKVFNRAANNSRYDSVVPQEQKKEPYLDDKSKP